MTRNPPRLLRHREISRLRARLERDSYPRLQMFLLVSLTGGAGFIASSVLLDLGLTTMWARYLVAFGFAYLAFLGLLWLWLRTKAEDYVDIPEPGGTLPTGGSGGHDCGGFGGEGGTGGGGGASGAFDGPGLNAPVEDGTSDSVSRVVDAAGEALGGADELAIPIALTVALTVTVGALLLSSLWIVYSAPLLFAELLIDGALAASLYHRLRGLETQHWLETAVRRTWAPFLLTALIVSAAGWGMTLYAPHAHSVGEVLAYMNRNS
jgi:hypothetical protein